jgi:hypothetical protein
MRFPVNDNLTIDNGRQKTLGKTSRMIIGCRVTKSQGIKEHCIRFESFAQNSGISKPQSPGGQSAHFMDGGFQRQCT